MIEEILAKNIIDELTKKNMTVAAAESCTGGLVAATLVSIPGASAVLNESYITYSNEAKHRILGVKNETLEAYGAVSEQTAAEMALGVAKTANANVGIATTGIAGPDGGTQEKPVGLVYIACSVNGEVKVTKNYFTGDRQAVRKQAVIIAMTIVNDRIS